MIQFMNIISLINFWWKYFIFTIQNYFWISIHRLSYVNNIFNLNSRANKFLKTLADWESVLFETRKIAVSYLAQLHSFVNANELYHFGIFREIIDLVLFLHSKMCIFLSNSYTEVNVTKIKIFWRNIFQEVDVA